MKPFWDDHWTWQQKDNIDQPAHAFLGFVLAWVALVFTQSYVAAVLFSTFVGCLREWLQKPDRKVGLNKDSTFWFVGSLFVLFI